MEALSVTDHHAHSRGFGYLRSSSHMSTAISSTRPQHAGSSGDTDLVNDDGDIRRIPANEHHATPARSRTGGRR